MTRFEDLGLSPRSLKNLLKIGFEEPSPIQAAFIPIAISGADCIGQAQTGTGKTAAFVLPILERIDHDQLVPQALVLTPTRELSTQVAEEAIRLSGGQAIQTVCLVGGRPIRRQMLDLQNGAHVVIGTPGRVIDLLQRRSLDVRQLKLVVMDEADRMLDIGFRPDIERILKQCPTDRQTLLLSATMPVPVRRLAQKYMRDPSHIDVTPHTQPRQIEQFYLTVDHDRKFAALVKLLQQEHPRQAIVFTRTKRGAEQLFHRFAGRLKRIGFLHGDLAQSARDRTMKQFRSGMLRMIIATDVMGRGIDISGISHIINYDVPEDCDDYVHRIGRTGRLSSSNDRSAAITLITPEEGLQLTNIEKRVNRMLAQYEIPNFEPVRSRPRKSLPPIVHTPPKPKPTAAAASSEEEDPWVDFG